MNRHSALHVSVLVLATSLALACDADRSGLLSAQRSTEAVYLAQNSAAMGKMMAGMMAKPTGDVDRDFVDMMVPHHQGAIDMAVAVLRYGRNERIRRLAQEIIVTQREEIAAMRLAVGESLPPSEPSPTQAVSQSDPKMPAGMTMK
jgi:uncharacterized protein (DUF305 family)